MTKCCRTDVTIMSISVAMVESVDSAADGIYQAAEKLNDDEIKLVPTQPMTIRRDSIDDDIAEQLS